jgi:hypothetical protein
MKSLTSFLVYKGAVSPKLLQEVLMHQTLSGGGIGINLLEVKAISEISLVQMAGQFHRLLVVALQDLLTVPPDVTGLMSRDLAIRLNVLPFDVKDESIYVACFQPPPKKDEMMIRNITGKVPRFFVASPLAIAIALWIHYGEEIGQRAARIIERINRDEAGIIDDIVEKVPPSRRAHLMAIIEKRWEAFPVREEKRDTLLEFVGEEEETKEQAWGEERESDESYDEIFNKYIVINRIGKRPRRPSAIFIKSPLTEGREGAEGTEGLEGTDVMEGEEGTEGTEGEEGTEGMEGVEEIAVDDADAPGPEAVPVSGAPEGEFPMEEEIIIQEEEAQEPVEPAPQVGPAVRGYPIPILGMLTLNEVLVKVKSAENATEVTDAVYEFATQFFDFIMMFRYRKGRFELAMASSRGWGFTVEDLSVRHLYSANLPETLITYARPCLFNVPEGHPVEKMLEECGRNVPPNALFMPISVQERVVVFFYGDNGKQETGLDEVRDLFHAAWAASHKLLSFIAEKKR